ncbi:MAG: outer membrane lipoprotein-sorting protein [Salibacteraceae bacterium]|jgi:outer membrane lipoprotein-sorting protein
MKKLALLVLVVLSISIVGLAQNENPKDPKAKSILDKVSAESKSHSTIYMEFSYRIVNKPNAIDETQEGKVWIKSDQYKLMFPGLERYSDGKTMWTYLEDDDECQISSSAGDDEEENISPSSLLTIYENGFNYLYGNETTINGKKVHMIKLFPEGGGKSYHTIKVYVNPATNQMARIEVFSKDGNTFTYDLKVINNDIVMDNSLFVFDTSKAGDIVDLRD